MKICGPGAQHTRLQVDIDTMYLSDRFTFTLLACHELKLVQRSFQNRYNEIKKAQLCLQKRHTNSIDQRYLKHEGTSTGLCR